MVYSTRRKNIMKNILFKRKNFFIKSVAIVFFICVSILGQDNKKGFEQLNTGEGSFNTIRAVIVGISDYINIASLDYADKDAVSFYNFLRSSAGGNIDSLNIKLLTNENANAIQIFEALDWITSVTEEGDLALFYFSGHGDLETKTVKQNGFLLAHDAPTAAYMAGGTIGIRYLQDYLETIVQINKASVILISDACKSGKLAGGMDGVSQTTAALQQDWTNIIKILSSQPGELSYESDRWGNGAGVFTYYLLQGLMGLADMNHDNHVNLKELDIYLSMNIPGETNFEQNPIFLGNPKTLLANVDSLTLASLLDNELSKPGSHLLAMKGNEQSSPSVDTTTSNLLKKFQFCLNNGQLIYPLGDNALNIYYDLKNREDLKSAVSSMKYSLIAALQNNSQKLINIYLQGKVEKEEPVDLDLAYEELDEAFWLIDSTYILYDQIKAKHSFMESLFYTTNEFDKRIDLLNECIFIQPDASYAYCELGRAYHDAKRYDDAITNYNKAIELSPRWKYPNYNIGIVYADLNKYETAIEFYQKAVEIDPNYTDALNNLGIVYKDLGDQKTALEYYNKALEIDSNYKLANYNIAIILDDIGETDRAIDYYEKTIEIDPYYAQAYYNLAIIYSDRGEIKKAIDLYTKSIEADPYYTNAYNNLGLIYDNLGDQTKAIEIYNNAIEVDPGYKLAYYNLGLVYYRLNEADKSIENFQKVIEIDSGYVDAYHYLGLLYSNIGDETKAIECYSKELEIDPNYKLGYYNLAIVYNDIGETEKAIYNYKKTIEIDPSYANAYNNLGLVYDAMGEQTKAIELYNSAIEVDQGYKLAYYNLGLVYSDLGDTEKALYNFNMTIELDSNYVNAYDKAGFLYYQTKDYKSGINFYNKYIELYPDDYYGYQIRGMCYFYDRNYELSIVDLKEVIELYPEYSGGYYNLACYYSVTNNAKESLTNLDIAFQLGYRDFDHIETDSDLDGIRSNPDFNKLIEKYKK